MSIVVKARHMDVTDAMRQYVERKAAKLTKFYDQLHNVEVTLSMEADKPSVEILASAKKKVTFVASHRDDDMYGCIDQCLDKISEQIRRHKDRIRDHHSQEGTTHGEAG